MASTSRSLNMNTINRGRLKQRFDLIRKLGQGTYGKVQLGINKTTGQEVALKTIKKSKIENDVDLLRIKREINIMSCCDHPNIIHIYEVFENHEKIILVMEYAPGGELYDYLNERKKLNEPEAKRLFSQIASAIYYCHKHFIVHRDLKLENILLDKNFNAKIADFGLSNVYGEGLLSTFCGSPLYASPEIVKGIPYSGPEVDCWSLGVLLYTLIYGSMPFDGSNFKKLVKQITTSTYFEPAHRSGASPLIKALLTVDPAKRLNIQQIVAHAWLQSTDCQTVSEEYCNLAPAKGEFLIGINSSPRSEDTLDECSEISALDGVMEEDKVQVQATLTVLHTLVETEPAKVVVSVCAGAELVNVTEPDRDAITPLAITPEFKLSKTNSQPKELNGPKPKRVKVTKKAVTSALPSLIDSSMGQKVEPLKKVGSAQVMISANLLKIDPAPSATLSNTLKVPDPPQSKIPLKPVRRISNSDKNIGSVVHNGRVDGPLSSSLSQQLPNSDKMIEPELKLILKAKSTNEQKPSGIVNGVCDSASSGSSPALKLPPAVSSPVTLTTSPGSIKSEEPTQEMSPNQGEAQLLKAEDAKPSACSVVDPSTIQDVASVSKMSPAVDTTVTPATVLEPSGIPSDAKPKVKLRKKKPIETKPKIEDPLPQQQPTRIARRNSKVISQKTAELIQNLKETNKSTVGNMKKQIILPSLNLSDVKKKFEAKKKVEVVPTTTRKKSITIKVDSGVDTCIPRNVNETVKWSQKENKCQDVELEITNNMSADSKVLKTGSVTNPTTIDPQLLIVSTLNLPVESQHLLDTENKAITKELSLSASFKDTAPSHDTGDKPQKNLTDLKPTKKTKSPKLTKKLETKIESCNINGGGDIVSAVPNGVVPPLKRKTDVEMKSADLDAASVKAGLVDRNTAMDNRIALSETVVNTIEQDDLVTSTPSLDSEAKRTPKPSGDRETKHTPTPFVDREAKNSSRSSGDHESKHTHTPSGDRETERTPTPSVNNEANLLSKKSGDRETKLAPKLADNHEPQHNPTPSGDREAKLTPTPSVDRDATYSPTLSTNCAPKQTHAPSADRVAKLPSKPSGDLETKLTPKLADNSETKHVYARSIDLETKHTPWLSVDRETKHTPMPSGDREAKNTSTPSVDRETKHTPTPADMNLTSAASQTFAEALVRDNSCSGITQQEGLILTTEPSMGIPHPRQNSLMSGIPVTKAASNRDVTTPKLSSLARLQKAFSTKHISVPSEKSREAIGSKEAGLTRPTALKLFIPQTYSSSSRHKVEVTQNSPSSPTTTKQQAVDTIGTVLTKMKSKEMIPQTVPNTLSEDAKKTEIPSYSRQSSVGTPVSNGPIQKSRREFVIPITMEPGQVAGVAAASNSSTGVLTRERRPSTASALRSPDTAGTDDEFFENGAEPLSPDNLFSSLLQRVRGLSQRIHDSEQQQQRHHDVCSRRPTSPLFNGLPRDSSLSDPVTVTISSASGSPKARRHLSLDDSSSGSTLPRRHSTYLSSPRQSYTPSYLTLPRFRFSSLNETADEQQSDMLPSESVLLQKAVKRETTPNSGGSSASQISKFFNTHLGKLYSKRTHSDCNLGISSPSVSESFDSTAGSSLQPDSGPSSISDRILRKSYYTRYNHLPNYKATKELSANITRKLEQLLNDI